MKAVDFIRKFGWDKTIHVINTDFLTNGEQLQLAGVIVNDLKKYTDAYKLVQKFGGLKEAQRLHYDEFRSDKSYNEIQQAITLVEEVGWFEAMNLIKEKINE